MPREQARSSPSSPLCIEWFQVIAQCMEQSLLKVRLSVLSIELQRPRVSSGVTRP